MILESDCTRIVGENYYGIVKDKDFFQFKVINETVPTMVMSGEEVFFIDKDKNVHEAEMHKFATYDETEEFIYTPGKFLFQLVSWFIFKLEVGRVYKYDYKTHFQVTANKPDRYDVKMFPSAPFDYFICKKTLKFKYTWEQHTTTSSDFSRQFTYQPKEIYPIKHESKTIGLSCKESITCAEKPVKNVCVEEPIIKNVYVEDPIVKNVAIVQQDERTLLLLDGGKQGTIYSDGSGYKFKIIKPWQLVHLCRDVGDICLFDKDGQVYVNKQVVSSIPKNISIIKENDDILTTGGKRGQVVNVYYMPMQIKIISTLEALIISINQNCDLEKEAKEYIFNNQGEKYSNLEDHIGEIVEVRYPPTKECFITEPFHFIKPDNSQRYFDKDGNLFNATKSHKKGATISTIEFLHDYKFDMQGLTNKCEKETEIKKEISDIDTQIQELQKKKDKLANDISELWKGDYKDFKELYDTVFLKYEIQKQYSPFIKFAVSTSIERQLPLAHFSQRQVLLHAIQRCK